MKFKKLVFPALLVLLIFLLSTHLVLDVISAGRSETNSEEPETLTESENLNLCGPIALSTICQELGVETSVDELAKLAQTDATGTTMYGLAQAARQKGLTATGMKMSFQELRKLPKPVILHTKREREHFMVLWEIEIEDEGAIISDKEGQRILSIGEFREVWDGYVLSIRERWSGHQSTQPT